MDPELIADRYRVVRPIGRGGMGTVWLCEDGVLNRRVAVKRIGGLPGDDTDQAARAMREARVTAALNHDHAVSVFDVVDEGGATWLVMEYVPSRTLAELIKAEGPLTPRRAASIGAQVADALATAHGLAIVHRDVKPGNILVSEGDRAKISDFGIARGHTDLTLTQTGMMTGTPTYFAPELARGEHPSFASDVWALGATLFSAVEGKPPFPAQETPLATLGLIARESAPRAERAGPLADVIAAMLAREPTQRWSMERVRTALEEVAQSDTVPAPVPVPVPEPTPSAAAAPPPRTPAPTESPDVPHTREPATSGRTSRAVRWGIVAAVALIVLGAAGLALWVALSNGSQPSAASPGADRSPKTSGPASSPTSPAESTSPESTTDTTTDPTTDPPAGSSGNGSAARAESFVSDYYTLVPEDLDAGWAELSPDYQREVGRSSYDGFWSGIDSVELSAVDAVAPKTVDYTITYHRNNGDTSTETKEITLVRDGSSYLISGDAGRS